jgi:hypothetical protein
VWPVRTGDPSGGTGGAIDCYVGVAGAIYTAVSFTDCIVSNNTALTSSSHGGGISVAVGVLAMQTLNTSVVLTGCTMTDNGVGTHGT